MTFFACMCNQPEHLARALAPARAALVAPGPIARWGVGTHQGGEVLLARTPKPSGDVDLYAAIGEISSDCVIGQAIAEADAGGVAGNDNTPPFRFRRWMFAQAARHPAGPAEAWLGLGQALERLPEFLRRNVRGRTPAEVAFHALLAQLHDQGVLDDPNVPLATTAALLGGSQAMITTALTAAGATGTLGNVAVSNGRTMLVARTTAGDPLWLRRLTLQGEKTGRDEAFRGVLVVSRAASPGDGFEEVPPGQVVQVARDLRIDIATLPS